MKKHMELGLEELDIVTDEQRKAGAGPLSSEAAAALDAFNRIYDHLDACEVMADSIHNDMNIIAEALKRNDVPVIEGLEGAIEFWNKQTDWSFDFSQKHIITQAARAYAALQKGV